MSNSALQEAEVSTPRPDPAIGETAAGSIQHASAVGRVAHQHPSEIDSSVRLRASFRYAFAIAAVALAILSRWWLGETYGLTAPFVTFYPAVVAVAGIAGGGPGILATALSALAADYWFFPPGGFGIANAGDALAQGLFVVAGLLISGGAERLRRARWTAAVNAALQRANRQLLRQSTDLQRAEEQARRQFAEIEAIYNSAGVGLCVIDRQLRYVRINDRLAEINGVPSRDHIGKTVREIVPDLAGIAEKIAERVFSSGIGVVDLEIAGTTASQPGELRTFVEQWLPLKNDAGETVGINLVVEDITQRKRAEEILRRTSERLALLSEVSSRLLAAPDPQLEIEDLCRRAMAHLNCDAFLNFLVDESAGKLRLNSCAGIPEEEVRRIEWLEFGASVCGCAARDASRIVAEHIPSTSDARTELVRSYGIKAYACHPLLGPDGKAIGTLSFGTRTREIFSEEDLSLMKAVADQVATAMIRMQGEQALRRSQGDLKRAQAVARTGSWWLDTERNQLVWSEETYRLFGIPQGTPLTYESFLATVHPEDRDYVDRSWREAARGGPYDIEHRIQVGENVRWLREKAELDFDAGGRLLGGFGTVQDITERKQTELNQTLATEVLRALNRGAGDVHATIAEVLGLVKDSTGFDAVGLRMREGDDFPYYVQDGFSDDFLQKENFLCAKDLDGSLLRGPDGRPIVECTCGVVLTGRTDPESPLFTKGGSFWTNRSSELLSLPIEADPRTNPRNRCIHAGYQSVALIPVRSGEGIIGLLQLNDRREGRFTPELIRFFEGLAENIGLGLKRKQMEEALATAKAFAEEANAAKDKFLAVLSHELRTPLSPVLMAASALEFDDSLPEPVREDMALIRRSVELEVRLINDLLDFNRVKWSKLHLDMKLLDACEKLQAAVDICRSEAHVKQVRLDCELLAESSYVVADGARLQQVFWNLLKNAIKFTPENGRIVIRCSNPDPDRLRIEVMDNGLGIDPEALPHIFDAFVQASTHVARQFGGLGLGLAISKSLVEMHGGSIRAESAGRGHGTTFIVELPTASRVDASATAAVDTKQTTVVHGLQVLLVEDHDMTAEVLSRLLTRLGHSVTVASTAAEGLRKLTLHDFDLLISDLGLPDGSGHDLMRQVREIKPQLRALAMSGYGMDADLEKSRHAGFIEHLTKPVDLQTLQAAIARVTLPAHP